MNAPVTIARAALPDLIERARACLGDGDLEAARLLSARAYDTARQATAYARRFEASEQLLRKAHVLQGEALLIEAEVQIAVADMIDAGQAAGLISKGGRPKAQNDNAETVPGADLLHLNDFRIAKQRLAEARALRDAERAEPGLAERAIRARLEEGQEPTRASLRAAIGTRSASRDERGDNFYQTPAEAIGALLALERFGPVVWEPACGLGAIAGPLEAAGYDVILSDLRDRGCADRHGEVQAAVDFLETDRAWLAAHAFMGTDNGNPDGLGADIITNPPYGETMNRFIRHALETFRPPKMAMLCNLNVLAGCDDADRTFFLESWPPARIHVFTRRLPMMHREGWGGPRATSQMNTCWLVWERAADWPDDRPYGDRTVLHRVDWKSLQDAAPLPPGRV